MRNALYALLCTTAFVTTAMAQQNALTSALDSPIKMEVESYAANEAIACSLVLPASAALFGTDFDTTSRTFITNELFSPFRLFQFDENCAITGTTWSTAGVVGTTATGIGYPNGTAGTTYWLCDPFGGATITEYGFGTGIATGATFATPVGGSVWGSLVVDNNQTGEVMCINEIALDSYTCVNAAAGGSVLCFYPNADNSGGGGAFGNGSSDAVSPGDCSGQTLVNASGTITEGQVNRAGQYDCTGNDPACTDRWNFAITGSFFINGIAEYSALSGARNLMCADNVTSTMFNLEQPVGIADCQDVDPGMNNTWVNGSQGDGGFLVDVDSSATLTVGVQRTPAGNGKFLFNMWQGRPSASTISPLFDLGNQCFAYINGPALVIEQNIGKTNLLGVSNYFGVPVPDPSRSPTFINSLTQARIDTANLPVGSLWTVQGVALNGAASSLLGASLTNAVVFQLQ